MKKTLKLSVALFTVIALCAAISYLPGFATPPLPPIEMDSEIKITRASFDLDEVTVDFSFGYSSVMNDFFITQKSAMIFTQQEEKFVVKEYPDFSEEHFKLDVIKTTGCVSSTFKKFNYTETVTIPREVSYPRLIELFVLNKCIA